MCTYARRPANNFSAAVDQQELSTGGREQRPQLLKLSAVRQGSRSNRRGSGVDTLSLSSSLTSPIWQRERGSPAP